MKNFIEIISTVFEIWTKNVKNAPKKGVFPDLRPQKIFFKNQALSLFIIYQCLTSYKESEKLLEVLWEK